MARILLDACVPVRFGRELHGHSVSTAREMGWGDLDDSDLLWAMHGKFDVLITVDKSIPHQQAAARKEVAVIVMRSIRVRLPDLLPFVPTLLGVLDEIRPGEAREIRV